MQCGGMVNHLRGPVGSRNPSIAPFGCLAHGPQAPVDGIRRSSGLPSTIPFGWLSVTYDVGGLHAPVGGVRKIKPQISSTAPIGFAHVSLSTACAICIHNKHVRSGVARTLIPGVPMLLVFFFVFMLRIAVVTIIGMWVFARTLLLSGLVAGLVIC